MLDLTSSSVVYMRLFKLDKEQDMHFFIKKIQTSKTV